MKCRLKKLILIVSIIGMLLCVITYSVRYDKYEQLLNKNNWSVSSRVTSGIGMGEMSGMLFKSGTLDSGFTEYVTDTLGIKINDNDNLRGYAYILENVCIERNVRAYFLEKDGELLCAAVWVAEDIPSVGRTFHNKDSFFPLNSSLRDIRVDVIKKLYKY